MMFISRCFDGKCVRKTKYILLNEEKKHSFLRINGDRICFYTFDMFSCIYTSTYVSNVPCPPLYAVETKNELPKTTTDNCLNKNVNNPQIQISIADFVIISKKKIQVDSNLRLSFSYDTIQFIILSVQCYIASFIIELIEVKICN
jgi:hypothetical protein